MDGPTGGFGWTATKILAETLAKRQIRLNNVEHLVEELMKPVGWKRVNLGRPSQLQFPGLTLVEITNLPRDKAEGFCWKI